MFKQTIKEIREEFIMKIEQAINLINQQYNHLENIFKDLQSINKNEVVLLNDDEISFSIQLLKNHKLFQDHQQEQIKLINNSIDLKKKMTELVEIIIIDSQKQISNFCIKKQIQSQTNVKQNEEFLNVKQDKQEYEELLLDKIDISNRLQENSSEEKLSIETNEVISIIINFYSQSKTYVVEVNLNSLVEELVKKFEAYVYPQQQITFYFANQLLHQYKTFMELGIKNNFSFIGQLN